MPQDYAVTWCLEDPTDKQLEERMQMLLQSSYNEANG
jgi:hypothetical protein